MNIPAKQRKPRETKLPTHPAILPSALDEVFVPPAALTKWERDGRTCVVFCPNNHIMQDDHSRCRTCGWTMAAHGPEAGRAG